MSQTSKKGDVEFIISGDDNVTQIFKGIIEELHHVRNQTQQTGRDVNRSLDDMATSSRRASDGVETIEDRLERLGQETATLKKLNNELHQTEDSARDAGREMERGFRDGGQAAERAESKVKALKSRVTEVAREMRNMFSAINEGTMGFQTFVGDQIKRGAMVGGVATIGFAASSLRKQVNQEYEFAKLGSVVKSGYMDNHGVLNEKQYNADFADLKEFIRQQGLRPDRETDILGAIGISSELAKSNMGPKQIKAALPVVSDFAQASGLDPDVASKYLANKLEAAKMAYTPENFAKVADQFMKTVDMSSLDPQDLLYAEKYTDFGNAIGNVDYAISQAMQVLLSKISVEGETGGTALRTLFLESSNMSISDSARSNVSSEKVGRAIDAIISQVNKVNAAVDADKSVAADQKGNEKILRKAAIMNKYMNQLTADQQLEVGATLFGKEAASVTTIFANDGYQNLLETIDAIRGSSGITKRYADDRSNTSKGDMVAFGKAVDEIQGKVGRSLEPLLAATTKQMTDLATEGKFSFEEIQKGVDESAKSLSTELNPEIADVFKQLTDLTVNGFQIGVALSPMAEGAGKAILKLLNGDLSGAAHEIVLAIDATDLKIENLPGELEGLATAAKNAAIFLAAMVAVDKGVKLGENLKKIYDAAEALKKAMTGKTGGGTMFDAERNIRANVVNVYGDRINVGGTGGAPGGGKTSTSPTLGKPEIAEAAGGGAARTALAETGITIAGVLTALGLAYSVGSVVSDAVNDISGNKLEERRNVKAGADFWFQQSQRGDFFGNSADQTTRWHKEMIATGNMIAGYRNRVPDEILQKISSELWDEAVKNMKSQKQHIFGDNIEDAADYVDRRIKKERNISDVADAQVEKKLRIQKQKEWGEQEKLKGYYEGMPDGGMWKTPEPSSRDKMQRVREIEHDPFAVGTYKRQLVDQIIQRPVVQQNTASQLIPQLFAEMKKMNEKPIEVHSDNNIRVVVEDNRAVQVMHESISDYANRTYNARTLTPMQMVKMRQLE